LKAGPSKEEAWEVNRIELSDPDDKYTGDWFDYNNGFLQISSPSNYDYEESGYNESGTIKQFIYIDLTYFLSNTTYSSIVDGGAACDAYYVGQVTLNEAEDEMTIHYGEDQVVYTRTENTADTTCSTDGEVRNCADFVSFERCVDGSWATSQDELNYVRCVK
jgi:hypothetical protein